jgi:homoserine O-acetyltransferase/O-succinyltransferase
MSVAAESVTASIVVQEDVLQLSGTFPLEFGGALTDVRVAWRLAGATGAPVIAVLGGISAGRRVYAASASEQGWWKGMVGPDAALDASRFRILGIDFLGGSGETTGPVRGQSDFPSISAYDQANIVLATMKHLSVNSLHAIVGASYGGMVALAFAERHLEQVGRLVVISAADRPHPMASAWRSVQRATVKALAARGAGAEGLKLARALAMTTYRSVQEFKQRFDGEAVRTATGFKLPVEDYLYARGEAYAQSYVPEAFVCLSESIDLHRVDPARIHVPTTLVAVREDQLVPLSDIQDLHRHLAGPKELIEFSSLYGHDAFLKEAAVLQEVFAKTL